MPHTFRSGCFGKLILPHRLYARFFLLEIKPPHLDEILFDVLQNFHHFSVSFAANVLTFSKQSSHNISKLLLLSECVVVLTLRTVLISARKNDQLTCFLVSQHLFKLFNGCHRSVVYLRNDKPFADIRVARKLSIA